MKTLLTIIFVLGLAACAKDNSGPSAVAASLPTSDDVSFQKDWASQSDGNSLDLSNFVGGGTQFYMTWNSGTPTSCKVRAQFSSLDPEAHTDDSGVLTVASDTTACNLYNGVFTLSLLHNGQLLLCSMGGQVACTIFN